MLKFALLFPLYLVVLFVLELLAPVDRAVIAPWTAFLADLCGGVMRMLDSSVIVHGNIIAGGAAGFAIAVERGCNGVEAVIILVASMLAYPATWRQRGIGIGVGFVCVQALNMVRIISLYYLGNWNRVWFDWFHLYVWQALIVADALVVFLLWLAWIRRRTPAPPPASPTAVDAAVTPA